MGLLENEAVLIFGGNIGDTICIFESAITEIQKNGCKISNASSTYRTAPWGFTEQRHFLNKVYQIQTDLTPYQLFELTQSIEKNHMKSKSFDNGPRILDIDILYFGNKIIDLDDLKIPHPRMHLRRFNLAPLLEILPEHKHPITGLSTSKMLEACDDESEIQLIETKRCTS
ncbi:MAG: 2-amino-4-hydroxy-6-hydroxymethyldihydropteridine diphosphokinase [Bacteroidota bacterium]|jgi:2-amino-4-hydroxy-6-hydroxymethyldihydropteridine diphosphokinase